MEALLSMLYLLILLCLLCLNKLRPCHGIDRITANQSLSGDQTLVSPGGIFELGFFSPRGGEGYYIGIWYKQVSPRTVIWEANRDSPLWEGSSLELKISYDGNLAIFFGGSKTPSWSTDMIPFHPSSSVNAVLLDQGNLVLIPTHGPPSPLWQSFDEPSDTLVPGSKIGFNKITSREVFLTSWREYEGPTPGHFSLKLGSNRSLEWYIPFFAGSKYFSGTRISELNSMNFAYADDQNGRYLTFTQYNRSQMEKIVDEESDRYIQQQYSKHRSKSSNDSLFSRYVVDVKGQFQLLVWLESAQEWLSIWQREPSQCVANVYCGAYAGCTSKSKHFCNCLNGFKPVSWGDYNSVYDRLRSYLSCSRSSPLRCSETDWFSPYYNVGLPINRERTSSARSSDDCKATCLRSCNCSAYTYIENQCYHWYDVLFNLQLDVPNGKTIFVKLAANESSFLDNNIHQRKHNKIGIVIGSVAGSTMLLVLVALTILRWRYKMPGKLMEEFLVVFTHRHLKIATKNFSHKLGEGGFGSVYKGTLPDSSIIAVKKLQSINSRHAENRKQFLAEVRTLGAIQHINLVGLRGFSSDNNTIMLVYDYMPNGSVSSHLFDPSKILDLKMRYNIALGTARGLAYIHENCRECIIHCDIKPDNVLLDSEFRPKVADFGLAKLFGRNFSRVLTTLRGTIGYMPPEWISGEAITVKADVYSYGMVLLELVSGMRNSQRHVCIGHYFPVWVANVINEGGDLAEVLDPRLQGNADGEELERICRVAVWCIQDNESNRPSMSQVVYILEQVLEVGIPPVPSILQRYVDPDS